MSLDGESTSERVSQSGWWETVKIVVQALALAMVVRVFFYQPFNIPSGSMKPTLLVGDYLFVSKLSYGYSRFSFPRRVEFGPISFPILPDRLFSGRVFTGDPKRGDVVVFKYPRDNTTDYIKRVVGMPGDSVQMQDGVLFINGKAVPKKRVGEFVTREDSYGPPRRIAMFEETLPADGGRAVTYRVLDSEPNGSFDNAGPYKVPAGHYFMMGDNRDNSTDSRDMRYGVGFVPHENLIGRAEIIFFSGAVDEPGAFRLFTPWMWPFDVRWGRFFNLVR